MCGENSLRFKLSIHFNFIITILLGQFSKRQQTKVASQRLLRFCQKRIARGSVMSDCRDSITDTTVRFLMVGLASKNILSANSKTNWLKLKQKIYGDDFRWLFVLQFRLAFLHIFGISHTLHSSVTSRQRHLILIEEKFENNQISK